MQRADSLEKTDAGKDWGQEEKGMIEDEMFGWHHWLSGHEFEQTLGDSEGQGSLEYCSPWGHQELDMTERLNNNSCLGPSPAFHSSVCESPQVIPLSWQQMSLDFFLFHCYILASAHCKTEPSQSLRDDCLTLQYPWPKAIPLVLLDLLFHIFS